MDLSIAALLAQDGITNGAIYALLALALVLVFTVTRVIWIPSGEFVAYGTLTLAGLQLGKPPGTVGLLLGLAVVAGAIEAVATAAPRRVRAAAAAARAVGRAFRLASRRSCGGRRRSSSRCPSQIALTLARGDGAGPAALPDRLSAARRCQRAGAADRVGRACIWR